VPTEVRGARRLDVLALLIAGAVDLLAGADSGLLLKHGSLTGGGDLASRSGWIADHATRWQAGWAFWFVVTTTFAWGFYALARNLGGARQWRDLAVGLALLAAAVDLVGIVLNLAVIPDLAARYQESAPALMASTEVTYSTVETLAQALTDIAAYGLYTMAGLLLLPALFATSAYPRRLAWLAVLLWGVSVVATVLLAFDAAGATAVFAVALLLYPLWIWASAWWLASAPQLASARCPGR
jgi:hypothetical protein